MFGLPFFNKHLTGYFKFDDGRIITEEQIAKHVMDHSIFIDRINPKKMIEMTFTSCDILLNKLHQVDPKPYVYYRLNSPIKK